MFQSYTTESIANIISAFALAELDDDIPILILDELGAAAGETRHRQVFLVFTLKHVRNTFKSC